MKIFKAYKTELDPNNKQRSYFGRCAGASRFVYNWGLAEWKRQYESGGKPSQYGLSKQFNAEKDDFCPWVREIPYAVTGSAFANLDAAFKNFFRRIKNGDEKPGYPKFKKRGSSGSFQVCSTRVDCDRVRITGAGWVRLKERDYIPMNAERYGNYATVSERAGRWFISVLVETEVPDPETPTGEPIGVDVGIKSLAVVSDGTVFENPKALEAEQKKLARLQRELARRARGGANYKKTKAKIAKCHARIAAIRSHALHNASRGIANKDARAVVLENLNVSGMLKNHKIARAMSDASVSELHRQIEYKAGWNGIEIVRAGRFFPSSKTCSNCGAVDSDLTLAVRTYRCKECGFELDRDLNAARNLAALAKAETQPDCLGS